MRIVEEHGGFYIMRGYEYFCFFVDHNSSSWSYRGMRQRYETREEAEAVKKDLNRRNRIAHKERVARRKAEAEETP